MLPRDLPRQPTLVAEACRWQQQQAYHSYSQMLAAAKLDQGLVWQAKHLASVHLLRAVTPGLTPAAPSFRLPMTRVFLRKSAGSYRDVQLISDAQSPHFLH